MTLPGHQRSSFLNLRDHLRRRPLPISPRTCWAGIGQSSWDQAGGETRTSRWLVAPRRGRQGPDTFVGSLSSSICLGADECLTLPLSRVGSARPGTKEGGVEAEDASVRPQQPVAPGSEARGHPDNRCIEVHGTHRSLEGRRRRRRRFPHRTPQTSNPRRPDSGPCHSPAGSDGSTRCFRRTVHRMRRSHRLTRRPIATRCVVGSDAHNWLVEMYRPHPPLEHCITEGEDAAI